MEIVKLLAIFAIIVVMLIWKKPLNLGMVIASAATILLYQLPLDTALPAIREGLLGQTTVNAILVLYTITFLQRMMEKRDQLSSCQVALNGIFNNRRVNASVAPFLLGCLPAASTVLICGPIVRESVGDNLSTEEKAAVTSFFRHISESFLPTYGSIFIAIGLTEGRVTAASWMLGMLPMVLALFLTGWLVYLRRIPKDTGMTPDQPKSYYWKLLAKSIWTIVLSIALILAFNMPVYLAVVVCVVMNFFVNHFSIKEVAPYFISAFEVRLVLNTLALMVFSRLIAATGVVELLPEYFSRLPIPTFLVYALIFFFGTMVAGMQAIYVLCFPMAIASVGDGPFLALFILLMNMSYVCMQIAPIHICLTLCADDFKIPLGSLIAKAAPMVAVFTCISFGYYFLLSSLGF